MKPKFRRFVKKALPALIVVPALMNFAQAAVIVPDSLGNVLVTGNFSGASTITATGGTTSPFTVTIESGASLTGDAGLQNGVTVSSNNYTINNSGSLSVAQRGVQSSNGDLIINNLVGGLIRGGNDGIHFDVDGGTIVNDGTIAGITGSYSDGIKGQDGMTITNNNSISGRQQGIDVGDELDLTNSFEATITGTNRAGVEAGDEASIENYGDISSTNDSGVVVGNDAEIYNFTTYDEEEEIAIGGGSIVGNDGNGITAGDSLYVRNENLGVINAENGNGIDAGDGAEIYNNFGAVITGSDDGVSVGSGLYLENSGNITGVGNDGVNALDGASITNNSTGRIRGEDGDGIDIDDIQIDFALAPDQVLADAIVAPSSTITNYGSIIGDYGAGIDGSDAVQTVNNHGYISGDTESEEGALNLRDGNDVTNLYYGSVIDGDINNGDGNDTINFYRGSSSIYDDDNIVFGNIYDTETINKYDIGTAFIGGIGDSFEVNVNTININAGGLTINGDIDGLDGRAFINVNGGEIDGAGSWNANVEITNGGGISAGAVPIGIAGDTDVETTIQPRGLVQIPEVNLYPEDSVGTLTITGDVTHGSQIQGGLSLDPQPLLISRSTYIREDIIPQTPIINGVNSDLIRQTGEGNEYDVTGAEIHISPTNVNKSLTNGSYTIVDSDMPILGFESIGRIGVEFSPTALETGPFIASQGGLMLRGDGPSLNVSYNTVLGNYFSTLTTTDPADFVENAPLVDAILGPLVLGGNTNLVLNVQHDFAGLPGLTPNQAALGGALDKLAGSPNPLIQDFIAALDLSDLATVRATLADLDPGNQLGLTTSIVNSNYRLHRLTQEHLAGVREGGVTVTETAPSTTDAKGAIVPGATTTHSTGRGNAWGSVSYDDQDYDANGTRSDYNGDTGSFTAGFDWRLAPQFVLGVVLDGSKGSFDGQGFSTDVDSLRAAVYGTWGASTGLYSDFLLGYGDHSLDSARALGGVLPGIGISNTDATSLQALWTVGFAMGDEKFKHGPFAGFEYQNVSVDGFTESGPLPISVAGYDVDSLRGLIGYRVNANLGMFRPYATVAYAHEFEDGANRATAFIGGTPFSVTGAEQSSAFLITVGTGISLSTSLSLDVGYRGEIATDDGLTSHGGSVGLNYSF